MMEQYQDHIWPGIFEKPPTDDNIQNQVVHTNEHKKQVLQKQKSLSKPLPPMVIKYPECPKGGYHVGEILNMACVDPKCASKSVICSICYQEEHRGHNIKPLRVVIERARKYLSSSGPLNINTSKVKAILRDSEKSLLDKFSSFENQVNETLNNTKSAITSTYQKMTEQVQSRVNSKEAAGVIDKLQDKQIGTDVFHNLVKELISCVPQSIEEDDDEGIVSEENIKEGIQNAKKKLQKQFETKSQAIKTDLKKYLQMIQKTAQDSPIFSVQNNYIFSPTLHHPGVNIISPNIAKAVQGYNYHFALLEPSLQQKGNKPQTIDFKINESTQSWVAVGICHKETVVKNDYTFAYSTLGHGAYMISCNGGSWSTLNSAHNNVVISFLFKKKDIISVEYDPLNMKVIFKKKGSNESHTLDFQMKDGNELHLCALFYYSVDEVQCLGHSKNNLDDN